MKARITTQALLGALPGTVPALQALAATARGTGIPEATLELASLRASQINGCSVCVELHAGGLRRAGESEERVLAVGAWRDSPYFSDAERAALALAEAATRIGDRGEVPDEVWEEAARHYDERALSGLVLSIALINAWNRINVTTRQVAGPWLAQPQLTGAGTH